MSIRCEGWRPAKARQRVNIHGEYRETGMQPIERCPETATMCWSGDSRGDEFYCDLHDELLFRDYSRLVRVRELL